MEERLLDEDYLNSLFGKLGIDPEDVLSEEKLEIPDTPYFLYLSEDTSSSYSPGEWFIIIKKHDIDTEIDNTERHKPPSATTVTEFKRWANELGVEGKYGLYSITKWQ